MSEVTHRLATNDQLGNTNTALGLLGKDASLQDIKAAILALPNATQAAADNANAAAAAATQAAAAISGMIAETYSSSKTYQVGDYVYYNGDLWRCETAITTAEAWTQAHWSKVHLGDVISDLTLSYAGNVFTFGDKMAIPPVDKLVQPSLNQTSGGNHIEFDVQEGEVYLISGFCFDLVSYPLIVMENEGSPAGTAGGHTSVFSDYMFFVPKGVTKIYVNGNGATSGAGTPSAIKGIPKSEEIENEITINSIVEMEEQATISGHVITKSLAENADTGVHGLLNVNPGDVYKISGFVYNSVYPLVVFANNNTPAGFATPEGNGAAYDFPVQVPENANKMYINGNGAPRGSAGSIKAKKIVRQKVDNFLEEPYVKKLIDGKCSDGWINSSGSKVSVNGFHQEYDVNPGECYSVSTQEPNNQPTIVFENYQGAVIDTRRPTGIQWTKITDYIVEVPENAVKMIVNGQRGILVYQYFKVDENGFRARKIDNDYAGKTCAWFGTSIPAAGYVGDSFNSYPAYVGRKLMMSVTNEAIGSSCVHCKDPERITESNPYGFIGNFSAASGCLTNTVEEMQWIIDHYDSNIWTSGTVPEMTESRANQIRANSYENKLDKYLTSSTLPDLFVFDHGNNDVFNSLQKEEAYYQEYGAYSLYTFRGAMNFLINRILSFNRYARIVMIGQYAGSTEDEIQTLQLAVADDWDLPICRQWELLGWSKTMNITCFGHWVPIYSTTDQYIWEDTVSPTTMSVFASWVPDGLHPHSDASGKALLRMADVIAKWLGTV